MIMGKMPDAVAGRKWAAICREHPKNDCDLWYALVVTRRTKSCLKVTGIGILETLISASFYPPVTAVARERSRSFCQKFRWQVAVKHSCTLRIWLNLPDLLKTHFIEQINEST